jgi:predicted nucleic acid-binding protein
VAISQTPFAERVRQTRDLGELMVMAHALVLRDQGLDVIVLIDEWRGQQLASRQNLRVMDTQSVLRSAARNGLITDRGQMRKVYAELRTYDDGLVDITQTDLLAKAVWTPRP